MACCCFKKGCEFEVQYICLCLSSETYSCELHLEIHLKLPNRSHILNSIFVEPTEKTKDDALEFFEEEEGEESMKEDLEEMISASFKQSFSKPKTNTWDIFKVNPGSRKNNSLSENISQNLNQDQLLNSKNLQPVSIVESDFDTWKIYDRWAELRSRRRDILNSTKNDQEIEQNFRLISPLYQNKSYTSSSLLNQAYQEYSNSYHQLTSLYIIGKVDNRSNFLIYDTESEREESRLIKIPPKKHLSEYDDWFFFTPKIDDIPSLDKPTCITQLPNCELFCNYKENSEFYRIFIINKNYECRAMPPAKNCKFSTAVYFEKNIYCFGQNREYLSTTISRRFNMDENDWFELAPMLRTGCICNSIIFKRNILISQFLYETIMLYSIDIGSFSTIPFEFSSKRWKILMSTNERVYLIDCGNGFIYESEDQFIWQQIATSNIRNNYSQVYCSYNKGGIYISTIDFDSMREYYKFDLDKKTLIEIGYYYKKIALKRLDDKIEIKNGSGQNFKFDSHISKICSIKNYSLYDLGQKLKALEHCEMEIQYNPNSPFSYLKKGHLLEDLEKYFGAIKCYNKSIKLDPYLNYYYLKKSHALNKLGEKFEEIECYNQATKLLSRDPNIYIFKGNALYDIGQKYEALKCYYKSVKLKILKGKILNYNEDIPKLADNFELRKYYDIKIEIERFYRNLDIYYNIKGDLLCELKRNLEEFMSLKGFNNNSNSFADYINKGISLNDLDENLKEIESNNEKIKLWPNLSSAYFNNGKAFERLGRQEEALECYNKAIEIDPDISRYLYYRACLFIDLGQEILAMQDFNSALFGLKYEAEKELHLGYDVDSLLLLIDEINSLYQPIYGSQEQGKAQDCLKLSYKLCTIEKIAIEFKDGQPKFKDFILKIPEKKKLRKKKQ